MRKKTIRHALIKRVRSGGIMSLALCAMLVAGGATAQTSLVNIDFTGGSVNGPLISDKEGFAAIGLSSEDVWNASRNVQGGSLAQLLYSDGTVSPMALQVTNASGVWANGAPDVMFDTYVYPFVNEFYPFDNELIEVGVLNVPAGVYDLYLYGHAGPDVNEANSRFSVAVGDINYGAKSTTTGPDWSSPTWAEGRQYVVFRGLFVEEDGQTIRFSVAPDAYDHGSLNGLQLARVDEILSISPSGTSFTNTVEVSVANNAGTGVVRYTIDGTDPSSESSVYDGPFLLTESSEVRARLFINGFAASEIVSQTYTRIEVPDIEFLPAGGLFTNAVEVVLVNNVGTGTIRYTTDGTVPVGTSAAYASPIELTAAATIRAGVFFNGFPISEEFSESYARVYAFEDDGVPFAWREQYFGAGFLTNPDAAADADPDNDNYTNREEYEEGTIPTDDDSLPEIELGIRLVPKLEFNTVPGKTYQVLRKASVDEPEWTVLVPPFVAGAPIVTLVDEEAPATAIYQIELVVGSGE